MKEALLKKRYRIPAALLLALLLSLLLSGTALAWYSFNSISSETTVQEPISTTEKTEFTTTMYAGETNTWTFEIVNSADASYWIKADLTYSAPDRVSITEFLAGGNDETDDLLDDNSATFSILSNTRISCSMKISADGDATTGKVSVSLKLSRQ